MRIANAMNVLFDFTRVSQSRGSSYKLTLMLYTQTGKNCCARVIARHLLACSPRTESHVQSSTVHPVPACARPHLAHSDAFFLGVGIQH